MQAIRYATRVAFATGASIASIRPAASALDQASAYTYTALNQLASETNFESTLTQYTYDEVGNLTKTVKAASTADVRTLTAQYDKQGRLTAELSGNASALLTGNQTQAEIDAIWAANAIKYSYDAAGRRTSTTDPNGNKTLFYYDADGRLTHAINALGEVKENRYNALGQLTRIAFPDANHEEVTYDAEGRRLSSINRLGQTTSYSYDALGRLLGQLTQTIAYGTRLSGVALGSLSGGLVDATLTSAVAGIANAALDSVTSYSYTVRGQVASTTDPLGFATSQIYNPFGEAITRLQQVDAAQSVGPSYVYDKRGLLTQTVWHIASHARHGDTGSTIPLHWFSPLSTPSTRRISTVRACSPLLLATVLS